MKKGNQQQQHVYDDQKGEKLLKKYIVDIYKYIIRFFYCNDGLRQPVNQRIHCQYNDNGN